MCEANQTQITQVRLLGFRVLNKFRILLFCVFLLTYLLILFSNTLIIILVTTIDQLKIPMFFFLKYLATYDILQTTTILPLALDIIIKDGGNISLAGCIVQLYFICISTSLQCYLIAAMSYDRYLAICHPLRYPTLMNSRVFLQMSIGFGVLSILLESSEIIMICQFDFCALNYVDHFFCDFAPLMELSTSDISGLLTFDFFFTAVTTFLPFACIILTYLCILVTILKISSSYGRNKAFSTCSSHLTTVSSFYGTLMIIYMVPSDQSSNSTNKYRSLLFILVSPILNPIIYSLRNQEMRRALKKLLAKCNICVC